MNFITTREAGEILGCSSSWVVKLLKQKKIKGLLITPRQWVVDKNSVLKLAKEREIKKRQPKLVK